MTLFILPIAGGNPAYNTSSERLQSDAGILILEKPYRLSALAQMVRRALDMPAENLGTG